MEKAEAILIRKSPLTETSLIVHWSTKEHGLLRTAAKGARRPASPFSGKLDLFYAADITFARSKRSDLHNVREVAVSNYRAGIQSNYGRVLCASYFCRLLEMAVEPEAPAPELHDLLERGLNHLAETDASLKAVRHFETETAKLLGIHPGGRTPAIGAIRQTIHKEPEQRAALIKLLTNRPPASQAPPSP